MSESIKNIVNGGDQTNNPAYAHLKPFEPAARIYCKKLGYDPDNMIECPNPSGLVNVPFFRPEWHIAAEELIELSMKLSAMREAAEQAGKGTIQ